MQHLAPEIRRLALLAAAVAVTTAAILGAALWIQSQGQPPCPLCILQRIAFLGIFGSALVATPLAATGAIGTAGAVLWLGVLSALAGLGVAARHVWELWHPAFTCGLDPLAEAINRWTLTRWMPWMFQADGLCAEAPRLLGLALPYWSALGYLGLGAALLAGAWRRDRGNGNR